MFRKLGLAFAGIGAAGTATIGALTIPLLRRLPEQSRVSMDGITTIDDAVEACRRTQLQGWDLVAYAQHLAARKFTYSRLIPTCVLRDISKVRKIGHRTQLFGFRFQVCKLFAQLVNYLL